MEGLYLSDNQLTMLTLPEGIVALRRLVISNPLERLRVPNGMNTDDLRTIWWNDDRTDFAEILSDPDPPFIIEFYEPSPPDEPDEPSPPRLSYRRLANGLEISWESGVLQKSPGVEGPWQDVDETSPLQVNPSLPAEFFRVRAE